MVWRRAALPPMPFRTARNAPGCSSPKRGPVIASSLWAHATIRSQLLPRICCRVSKLQIRNERQTMLPRMMVAAIAALLTAGATSKVSAAQPAPPAYKLVQTIPLGPAERWDYATFDPGQGRVYLAHGDHVTVVNAGTGALIGNIGPLPGGTHGIGISPENGVGFTDDGEAGIAAAFDLKTLK